MKEPDRQMGEQRGLQGLRITPARSVALFLLTLLLLNPPLLLVFDQAVQFFGLPLLFVYFFVSWALVILLIGLGTRRAPDLPALQEGGPYEGPVHDGSVPVPDKDRAAPGPDHVARVSRRDAD
ncbi:hypothetical protein [Fodinicurvata sediminis]|uniref:hypothetical protein n=1 Tax=Fodinicurvata sediminis TaxID=1121832 RepID=UPI001B7FD97F|nr:hypothetical protein [Fodinicurvata sediminis]